MNTRHSEEPQATKNLLFGFQKKQKQILRCAQDDRTNI